MRTVFKVLGLFFVGLGFLGAFLPILPTTPFLLLALWLFARSSPRLEKWLLTNRMFGKYISDFHAGRGIPFRVKIYILVLLWTTITYSAFWAVDIIFVKVLLLLTAVGVTIHIMRFKTKKKKYIVLLCPTGTEAGGLTGKLPEGCSLEISGVGMAETAAAVARVCSLNKPDMIILAGIGGVLPSDRVGYGDCFVIVKETVGDLGALKEDIIAPLFRKEYDCPYTELSGLAAANGLTVNCCGMGTHQYEDSLPVIENMEGAAFFAMCRELDIPFCEIRSVSNFTTDKREDWKVETAVQNLSGCVLEIVGKFCEP